MDYNENNKNAVSHQFTFVENFKLICGTQGLLLCRLYLAQDGARNILTKNSMVIMENIRHYYVAKIVRKLSWFWQLALNPSISFQHRYQTVWMEHWLSIFKTLLVVSKMVHGTPRFCKF